MNPMNRKMFRDPMASRRVTGILASSPELMTSVQQAMAKKQPAKAAVGMSVNTRNTQQRSFAEDIKALPTDVRNAVIRLIQSRPGTSVSDAVRQVTAPDIRAAGLRDAEMFMSTTGGPGDVENLGSIASNQPRAAAQSKQPFLKVGDVNLANAFSDGSPLDVLRAAAGSGPRKTGPTNKDLVSPSTIQDMLFPKGVFGMGTVAEQNRKRDQAAAEAAGEVDMVAQPVGSGFIPDMGSDDGTSVPAGVPGALATLGRDPDPVEQEVITPVPKTIAEEVSGTISSAFSTDERGGEPSTAADMSADLTGTAPNKSYKVKSATSPVVTALSTNTSEQVVPENVSSNQVVLTPTDASSISRGQGSAQFDEGSFDQVAAKETALTAKDLLNASGSLLKGTDAGRAEQNDANVGIEGTTKERVKKRLALMNEILGESDDIRNDANYNAMLFGLALASGTSGDLKTDLAEAGKTLLSSTASADAEERKNNRAVATAAISSVLEQEDKEAQRKAEKENLNTRLSSSEKIAILSNGTQLEIAKAQISQRDRALDKNIESEEWMAKYNASNKFKLAGVQMDHDTRLAAFSANEAFKRAKLGAEVQLSLAEFNQESLNNRLETQLAFEADKMGQDSAEVQRIKYLQNNPEARDMLVNIARESKKSGLNFDEELALKMAGNDALMYFPGGAAAMASTLKSLASGDAISSPGNVDGGSKIAAFNTRPSDDVLEALVSSGVTTINVGGQTFNIGTE